MRSCVGYRSWSISWPKLLREVRRDWSCVIIIVELCGIIIVPVLHLAGTKLGNVPRSGYALSGPSMVSHPQWGQRGGMISA